MLKLFALFAVLAGVPGAAGQNVFLALEEGSPPKMVKAVRNGRAFVGDNGKLEGVYTPRFALNKATIYRPGLVTVSNFRVRTTHAESLETGGSFNYELHIYGRAQSDVPLQNCFMVLELNSWKNAGCVYVEMRELAAGQNEDLDLTFRLANPLDEGTYRIHIFSDGVEVLHSKMPAGYLAAQKKKTEGLLSGKVQEFAPIPAVTVKGLYPPELKKENLSGSARIRFHIAASGEVTSVELVSATHPAFGQAALAVAPKWKFDPALKDRHMVEGVAELSLQFKPPS